MLQLDCGIFLKDSCVKELVSSLALLRSDGTFKRWGLMSSYKGSDLKGEVGTQSLLFLLHFLALR
jgi:hypothetical protein